MLEEVAEELGERIWSSDHRPEEEVTQSVIRGNDRKLLRLLQSGISPNSPDEVGKVLLYWTLMTLSILVGGHRSHVCRYVQ